MFHNLKNIWRKQNEVGHLDRTFHCPSKNWKLLNFAKFSQPSFDQSHYWHSIRNLVYHQRASGGSLSKLNPPGGFMLSLVTQAHSLIPLIVSKFGVILVAFFRMAIHGWYTLWHNDCVYYIVITSGYRRFVIYVTLYELALPNPNWSSWCHSDIADHWVHRFFHCFKNFLI